MYGFVMYKIHLKKVFLQLQQTPSFQQLSTNNVNVVARGSLKF